MKHTIQTLKKALIVGHVGEEIFELEKELREEKDWCERCLAEDQTDEYCMRKLKWIKEILGE